MFKDFLHEDYLHCTQTFLESVFNTMGEAIVVANETGTIIMVNQHVSELWGYSSEELLGKNLTSLMPEKFRNAHQAGMKNYVKTNQQKVLYQRLELEALHRSGHVFPIILYISETMINNERCFTAAIRDISDVISRRNELQKAQEQLIEAKTEIEEKNNRLLQEIRLDPKTRILNHTALMERLNEELDRLERRTSELSLLFMDIDNFKKLNDEHGHIIGDRYLVELANLVKNEIVRSTDIIARYGGEEFILILPDTSLDGAMVIAERMRKTVQLHTWFGPQITVTIGVTSTQIKMNPDMMIHDADKYLYYGKRHGRNQVNNYKTVK